MLSIYVLPTDTGRPPRAMLFDPASAVPGGEDDPEGAVAVNGTLATWLSDSGTWTIEGVPVDPALAQAITEHARWLGVDL